MIEIDYKLIPQWLAERNKLNKEWSKKYKALQLKQQEILQQQNYMECCDELERLKLSDEGNQKNLFGGYTSKNIKTLENLLKLYQKENLHLINMGQSLVQCLNYDIPGLKKQLLLTDQQIQSAEQRIIDAQISITTHKQQFDKQCKKYGIQGLNIEEEVPNMISQIPTLFNEIETLSFKNPIILQSIEYYREFTNYMNQSNDNTLIQNLESFIIKGNQKQQEFEIIENKQTEEIDWLKYMQPQQVKIQESELLDIQFRNNLVIDLNELISFYQTRIESNKQDQSITNAYSQNKLFDISIADINNYLDLLQKLLNKLIDPWLRQLLQLKSSIKTQERIIQNLSEYSIAIKKSEFNIITQQNKINDLREEQSKMQNQLRELQIKIKNMKSFTEKQFQDVFKTEIRLLCDC